MTAKTTAIAALLLVPLAGGCVINGNKYPRPRDLEPQWQVTRARVLAIAPEPPEAAPGDTVTFSALIADPEEEIETVVWAACAPTESSDFGCDLSAFNDLGDNPTPEELAEAGVIGWEPFIAPEYTPDEALLDGLTEQEALEGVQVTVQTLALPPFDVEDTGDSEFFNDVEVGFKRLIVSTAATPNANPVIATLEIGGVEIPAASVVEIEGGLEYSLAVRLTDESIQEYQYVNSDGITEDRIEAPYVTWYATDGSMIEQYGLYHDDTLLQGRWVAPDDEVEGAWYGVVRDRRGGMAWVEQPWRVTSTR